MKKTKWFALLAAGAVAVLAAGCDNGFRDAALNAMLNNAAQNNGAQKPEPAEGITLDREMLALAPGEKKKLTATASDNKTVEWSSSDDEVATVDDDGMVTAVALGTATITARADGKKATCEVNVHVHTYSGGKCTVCGSVPYMADATIDSYGTLTNYTGNAATVDIPYGVTSIGDHAFYGCTSLEDVTIPDSVTYIWYGAFWGCTSLTEVTIPKSVTQIDSEAFYGCSELERVNYTGSLTDWCSIGWGYSTANPLYQGNAVLYIGGEPVTDVVIPGDVTEIKNYAFFGYKSLASLEIPENVTSIGWSAFYGCSGLTNVSYKGTLAQWCALGSLYDLMSCAEHVTMGDGTDLKSLSTLDIPSDVESIGYGAFYGCSNLTSVTIGNNVTSIEESAFEGCSGLVSVAIGDSVTKIGTSAFEDCTSLTTVTIGAVVESIGWSAFSGCGSLASVTIPENVKTIGSFAFSGCDALTEVTIPANVTSIGTSAFGFCDKLATVRYEGSLAQWCAMEETGSITDDVESVIIGDGTDLKTLDVLEIPEGVESIGKYAFWGCTSLTSVTIPEGVKSIGEYAFNRCSNLTNMTIPASVTSIGWNAFSGCSSLTEIQFKGTKAQWNAIEKDSFWNSATGNYTIHCTDGKLDKQGNVIE